MAWNTIRGSNVGGASYTGARQGLDEVMPGVYRASGAASNALGTANEYIEKGIGAQKEAAAKAKKEQEKYYGQAQGYLEPWQQAGANALGDIRGLLSGETDITTDPSYQWRLEQGTAALERTAAAGGKQLSGQQLMAVTEFGQGLASTEFQNIYNRYLGVAQMGLQAGGQMGSQAMQMGGDMAQNALYVGAAEASGLSQMGQNTLFANALGQSGFGGGGGVIGMNVRHAQQPTGGTQPGWSQTGQTPQEQQGATPSGTSAFSSPKIMPTQTSQASSWYQSMANMLDIF